MDVDQECQIHSGGTLRFRDLTGQIVGAMNAEEVDDLAAACVAGFMVGGDPRCWKGFDELNYEAQFILNLQYDNWIETNPPDLNLEGPLS